VNARAPDAAAVSRAEIEDFLFHEADLLDNWRLDEWLSLMTEDAAYFVPPNDRPEADHRFTLFTIADDMVRLRERVIRLKDPNCHAEYPPSRTRRLITNVRITGVEGDEVTVEACFHLYRTRLNSEVDSWVGRRTDVLRRTGDGFRLARRHIFLDQTVILATNMSTIF